MNTGIRQTPAASQAVQNGTTIWEASVNGARAVEVNSSGQTVISAFSAAGSLAYVSGGTVVLDFLANSQRTVHVDGTTHVTTVNQDVAWNGTNVPTISAFFVHDTVAWPLSFDSNIRFLGASSPASTLPANEFSCLTLSVVGTTSQTVVLGAYMGEPSE